MRLIDLMNCGAIFPNRLSIDFSVNIATVDIDSMYQKPTGNICVFRSGTQSCQNKLVWVSCSCFMWSWPVGQHFSTFIYMHLSGCHLKTIIYRYFICGKYLFLLSNHSHSTLTVSVVRCALCAVKQFSCDVASRVHTRRRRQQHQRQCAKIVVVPRSHVHCTQ